MSNYNKVYLGRKAEKMGFIRDTLEKVLRIADILEYLNTNPLLQESLALKGGTAINLTIFNLLRLSVDIDLDYLSLKLNPGVNRFDLYEHMYYNINVND